MSNQRLLTYDDLAAFPDDGKRRELLEGELLVSPSPSLPHQEVVGELFGRLWMHLREVGGAKVFVAPLDVVLSPITVLEPDVFIVTDAQRDQLTIPNVQGPPAITVEVLSNPKIDRIRKRELYERYGVPEYWIVDPKRRTIDVHRFADVPPTVATLHPGEHLTTPTLPGFVIEVGELFGHPTT